MSQTKVARRQFIRYSLAASALPLAGISLVLRADDHRLQEDDPTAIALGYKHDASTVDITKYPRRGTPEGQKQFCHNCKLYQAGEDGWGGCGIFPGKQVKAEGWCGAWIATS